MTSPAVLGHRVIYLRPWAVCVPPNSMALLALAELPICVSNGTRTVSDVAQCALRTVSDSSIALPHSRVRAVSDITEAIVGEADGRGVPLALSCVQHACFLTGCQASHDVLVSNARGGPVRSVRPENLGSDSWDHTCRSARHAWLVDPQACCAPAPYDSHASRVASHSKDGCSAALGLGPNPCCGRACACDMGDIPYSEASTRPTKPCIQRQ